MEEKECICCDGGKVEDEVHFVVDCKIYADFREIRAITGNRLNLCKEGINFISGK